RAYIHEADVPGVLQANPDLDTERVEQTFDGLEIRIGRSVHIKFVHTPGHTPGSQCLLVNGCRLFSGDTLFVGTLGRLDFEDSSMEDMYRSMQKLKQLGDDVMVYPAHDYGGPFTTIGRERRQNVALRCPNLASFLHVMTQLNAGESDSAGRL